MNRIYSGLVLSLMILAPAFAADQPPAKTSAQKSMMEKCGKMAAAGGTNPGNKSESKPSDQMMAEGMKDCAMLQGRAAAKPGSAPAPHDHETPAPKP